MQLTGPRWRKASTGLLLVGGLLPIIVACNVRTQHERRVRSVASTDFGCRQENVAVEQIERVDERACYTAKYRARGCSREGVYQCKMRNGPEWCPFRCDVEPPTGDGTGAGPGGLASHICTAPATHFWKSMPIPVCWENPSPADQDDRLLVREAIRGTWERHSQVRFTDVWGKCNSGEAGIHILIADVNPASGVGVHELNGIDAKLKTVPNESLQVLDRGMVLNFTFSAWQVPAFTDARPRTWYIKVAAVHEFGHAIGFLHEQGRTDTPKWCTLRDTGRERACSLQDVDWDSSSVMNYCNVQYGGNGNLSAADQAAVERYYGAPQQCLPGEQHCAGRCVYVEDERAHCGSCGNACAPGLVCQHRACGCPSGTTLCGSECVSFGTQQNCARCGDSCSSAQVCRGGRCGPRRYSCTASTKCCEPAPENASLCEVPCIPQDRECR